MAENGFRTLLFVKCQNTMVERLVFIPGSGVAEESPVTFVCTIQVISSHTSQMEIERSFGQLKNYWPEKY